MDKIERRSLNVCICEMLGLQYNGDPNNFALADEFSVYLKSLDINISGYRNMEIGLRSGYLDEIFQRWLLGTSTDLSVKLTRTICNQDVTAKLTYTIYKHYKPSDNETLPFYVRDCLSYFETFIVINTVCSYVKGEGELLLERLSNMFPDSITVLEAGCLLACDYDNFQQGFIDDPVEKLICYYKCNGFISVNDKIGNYEESHIMARFNGGSGKIGIQNILNKKGEDTMTREEQLIAAVKKW